MGGWLYTGWVGVKKMWNFLCMNITEITRYTLVSSQTWWRGGKSRNLPISMSRSIWGSLCQLVICCWTRFIFTLRNQQTLKLYWDKDKHSNVKAINLLKKLRVLVEVQGLIQRTTWHNVYIAWGSWCFFFTGAETLCLGFLHRCACASHPRTPRTLWPFSTPVVFSFLLAYPSGVIYF
jgi:hypothetical protein